jgi:hypothetical protein
VLSEYAVLESNVDERADKKFREATGIKTGREAGATGSNRKPIPEDEGGTRDARGRLVFHPCPCSMCSPTDRNRLAPAGDYEGEGGPEDKVKLESERRPGDQDTLNLQDLKRQGLTK